MRICTFLLIIFSFVWTIPPAQAQDYRYVTPITSPIQKTVPLTAEVSPRQASLIQAPRDGVIEKIYAWPGDTVGNSAPLARLDNTELQEKKTKLLNQRNEFTAHLRRVEKLVERKLLDAEIWDRNLQKLAQIRAELAVTEEKIKQSLIRAPKRGTVLWSELEVGSEVKGAEPVYWIGDGKELWLSTYIEDEYSTGLQEDDAVAIFLDESSSPVLGRIDFISFGGPKGGNINLYIKAPRIGEIARDQSHEILVPIPADETVSILPEEVLTKDDFMFYLAPFSTSEPNKFLVIRQKPDIVNRENGAVYIKDIGVTAPILLNPPEDIEHRSVIEAYEQKENYAETYAAAVLKRDNTSTCGNTLSGESNADTPAASGGCSAGCGAAGGIEVADSENPEKNVCLVPADVFDVPEIDTENSNMPSVEEMMGQTPPTPENNNPDIENLPSTMPEDS